MNVTIVGGGNMGMCLAGVISRLKKYDVTILASHPEQFEDAIRVIEDEAQLSYMSGKIIATDKLDDAIKKADFIYCTYPAFLRSAFIEKAEQYIKPSATIGFIPAYGGAEFFCKKMIKKGVTFFGLQKPPYICRTKERGKIADLMSKKKELLLATLPNEKAKETAMLLQDMLGIKTEVMPNYMNVTLLPGNPLLHTSGSYCYLKDYKKGDTYPQQIYYYQSWNDECSRIICAFSDEMMNICDRIPIDLSGVQSIQTYYESPTPQALTRKFHSIPSFQPLVLPMIQTEDGFIPDFDSRYFTEDIPYGVCTIKALAEIVDVPTPTADKILSWYKANTGKEYFKPDGTFGKDIAETAVPQLFGIDSLKKLTEFYSK